jgi:hypothetical protein
MRFWFKPKYITLSEEIPFEEKRVLEQSIAKVLVPVLPPESFVRRLRHDLVAEAERQQATKAASDGAGAFEQRMSRRIPRILRVIGLVGGGILYVVGGVVVWLLWRNSDELEPARGKVAPPATDSKRSPTAALSTS